MVEFGIKEIYLLAAILLLFRFTTRKVSSMLLMYGIVLAAHRNKKQLLQMTLQALHSAEP